MNDVDDTIKLAEEFQATGISAIGVHGRKINERPQHFNNPSKLIRPRQNFIVRQPGNRVESLGCRDSTQFLQLGKG